MADDAAFALTCACTEQRALLQQYIAAVKEQPSNLLALSARLTPPMPALNPTGDTLRQAVVRELFEPCHPDW